MAIITNPGPGRNGEGIQKDEDFQTGICGPAAGGGLCGLRGGLVFGGRPRPSPCGWRPSAPLTQETPQALPAPTPSPLRPEQGRDTLAGGAKINLNTAGVDELMTLPGIGEKRAEDIIAYRQANGPFRIPEELTEVPGIGEGILEGLIDYVTTGEEENR